MATTPEVIEVTVPAEVQQEQSSAVVILNERSVAPITSNEEYVAVGNWLVRLKASRKSLYERFAEPVRKAFEAHRALTKFRDQSMQPYDEAIEAADKEMTRWSRERERLRLQNEQRQREEAARIARQQEEERQRLIREQEDAARKTAEDAQLQAAQQAQDMGLPEVADEILGQTVLIEPEAVYVAPVAPAAPIVIHNDIPKIKGLREKAERWDFEVIDFNAIPREYLCVDESKIRKVVNALKAASHISGIRVFPKP